MHHANLLVGSREWALLQIPAEERATGSDVSLRSYERMTIADARALIADATLRPVARSHRTFILDCVAILPEAQNALLKLLEDPPETARFFLIASREEVLLPTLRSRFHLLATEHAAVDTKDFSVFQSASYAERLASVAKKLDAEDTEWVAALIRGAAAYAEMSRDPALIRDVLMVESYIQSPGASKKMLLEHLALSLPQK